MGKQRWLQSFFIASWSCAVSVGVTYWVPIPFSDDVRVGVSDAWGETNSLDAPRPQPPGNAAPNSAPVLPLDAVKKKADEISAAGNKASAQIDRAGEPDGQGANVPSPAEAGPAPPEPPGYAYHPEGRRDPFMAIVMGDNKAAEVNLGIPPLQRVSLSELNVIGIIWGGFGYVAMVQTPDGRGYSVREGTRVGSGNGVVSSITSETLMVKEIIQDIYGRKEVREYVMLLHPKVNAE